MWVSPQSIRGHPAMSQVFAAAWESNIVASISASCMVVSSLSPCERDCRGWIACCSRALGEPLHTFQPPGGKQNSFTCVNMDSALVLIAGTKSGVILVVEPLSGRIRWNLRSNVPPRNGFEKPTDGQNGVRACVMFLPVSVVCVSIIQ